MNNNIIKRKMRVRYLCRYPFIYALLYLLSSCTSELEIFGDKGESGETAKIPIDFTAKLASGENAPVSKVRVIIFSTRSSIPEGPKVLVANEVIELNNNVKIETYVGYNDIYVIGNGPTELASIKTPQELKAILIPTQSNATLNDIVLFQQLLNVRIKDRNTIYIDGNSTSVSRLDIKLQHVMAKLSVNFDLNTEVMANGTSTNVFFNFKSMEIINIPKHSGLIPQIYKTTQGYMDNRSFDLTKNGITQNNNFKWSSGDIFLPEHLIDNDTYRTILLIKGEANNTPYTYTVSIGDSINPTDSKSDKWNVTRNRHYKLNIKAIKGYGTESLETSASVADWSEQNVPIEISGPNFITLTKQKVDVKSLRFPTYVRFASNAPIRIEYPQGLTSNEMKIVVHYDENATNKSGRIDISRGNWFTKGDTLVNVKVISGTISVNLKLNFLQTRRVGFFNARVDWATAMGYPSSANTHRSGYYNRALYKEAKDKGISTGCNDYFEGPDPNDATIGKGCWRLATIRENSEFASIPAWCIEEYGDSHTMAHSQGWNYFGHDYKTTTKPYVCVLDVRPPELADFIVSDKDSLDISKEKAEMICTSLGSGWKLPNGGQMEYVFNNAGTNGLPNNFFAESYWGKNDNGTFIVATMQDPDGSETTNALRQGVHAVRCLKSRY